MSIQNKDKKISHEHHRDRMRQKFRLNGFRGMSPHEVLEMLLFYSVPRRNTNDIAHELINRFGSLAGVLEATEEELIKVKGISKTSATLIRMIIPLYNEYQKQKSNLKQLKNPEDCGNFLVKRFANEPDEHLVVVCVDSSCRIIGFDDICSGDANSVMINYKKILQIVLKYPMATSVIVAHNHPGGLALPSREDIEATGELNNALKTIGISLIDHIVIAGDEYISMASSPRFTNIFNI